ncbi:hypothetical protein I6F35_16345 [Bradyrhizobium sp. BRP22]|uniref:hypothetical protein n=1 Tax=Bradyrhizobium sp. BRP22 TaxID=2793821 RepID=UPI001CD48C3E|nr:hypothetical protein [Bradyrhizobium sp. BRP22]MCA1454780.1 hypothetical protein [Bradyrhizobium sp. BRP22]
MVLRKLGASACAGQRALHQRVTHIDCDLYHMQFQVKMVPTIAPPMHLSGKDSHMATSEAEVQTAVRGGCALFKRMIANLEIRIRDERRRLAVLEASLKKAETQPTPDPALIEQLKQAIASLQSQIDEDETSLADIRIDFEMFCT